VFIIKRKRVPSRLRAHITLALGTQCGWSYVVASRSNAELLHRSLRDGISIHTRILLISKLVKDDRYSLNNRCSTYDRQSGLLRERSFV
jgi:hypothetical protein